MGERSVPFISALGCSSAMSLCVANCLSHARIGKEKKRKKKNGGKKTHIAQIPVPVPRSRTFCGEVNAGCLACGWIFVPLELQWGQNRASHRGEESKNGDCVK